MSKVLIVVKFGGALIFCGGTLTFLGAWEFFGRDLGHGKFFGHVVLVMGLFWI